MDPFGDATVEGDDMSNFQPPTDASALNGDFYETQPAEEQSFDYSAAEASFMQEVSDVPMPMPMELPMELPMPSSVPEYAPPPAMPEMTIPAVPEENELTKFMAKLDEEVAVKAQEQAKVGLACREKAQSEMTQFIEERARTKQAKQASNRVEEQATLEKLAADLEAENPWERVVSLVDLETNRKQKLAALNAKNDPSKKDQVEPPKAESEEEEDLSRMRQLFVQLKATPLSTTRVEGVAAH